jgi:hypothetical protein
MIAGACRGGRQSACYPQRHWWADEGATLLAQEGQSIEETVDGGLTLRFPTNSLFEVKRWVLSWGKNAKEALSKQILAFLLVFFLADLTLGVSFLQNLKG